MFNYPSFTASNLRDGVSPRALTSALCATYLLISCGADTSSQGPVGDASSEAGFVIQFPDALTGPDVTPARSLAIEPETATLRLNDRAQPASQGFTARIKEGNLLRPVEAVWTIDRYEAATISATGVFATKGITGGTFVVSATFGGVTTTATVVVNANIADLVPAIATPTKDDQTKLAVPPMAEATDMASVRYPLAGTVFPRGLRAPAVAITPGEHKPSAVMVRISGEAFVWEGSYIPNDPSSPSLQIPQDVWDAALGSNSRRSLKIEIIKLSGGKTFGPSSIDIKVAPATLRGAVYYMTYTNPRGLYSVRPDSREPAKHLVKGCVVCHSVSANGEWLSTGAESGEDPEARAGIYNVGPDGNAQQTAKTPNKFGGDTRGFSYAAWTPDGRFVVRSKDNFWGGPEQLAFSVNQKMGTLREVTVQGIGQRTSAFVPSFSPDGKRFVFTTGDDNKNGLGTPRRSLAMMDVTPSSDMLAFSNRKLIFDNGKDGDVPKFAAFLPDSTTVVFQEGSGYALGYGEMTPSWTPGKDYTRAPTRLWAVNSETGQRAELKRANRGLHPLDKDRNYGPSALPVPAGGYYWIVFTSQREHGNEYKHADMTTHKQLWVSAISPEWKPGEDPSHAPFLLPNQGSTHNERGYWALEPCRTESASCTTGDQCCGGFCRPADLSQPASPRMCQKPNANICAQQSEKCTVDANCCPDPSAGSVRCLGGFCTFPAPTG